ncbi:MAG: hypothetical protein ACRD96_29245, partial [Bryobacteraceae bacterium]
MDDLARLQAEVTEHVRLSRRLVARDAVTRVLEESATLREAAPGIFAAICESLDWEWAALWVPDETGLRCVET